MSNHHKVMFAPPALRFVPLLLSCAALALGQSSISVLGETTPSAIEPGSPASSYPLSGFEHYSPYTGKISFAFPLHHVGGRGTAAYDMTLNLQSLWAAEGLLNRPPHASQSTEYWSWWNGPGPGYGAGLLMGRRGNAFGPCGTYPSEIQYSTATLTFTSPDGTEMEMRDTNTDGAPYTLPNYCTPSGNQTWDAGRGTVFASRDGTSATFVSDTRILDGISAGAPTFTASGYLMFRDGTTYRIDNGNVTWLHDRNGNQISFTYNVQNEVTGIVDQNYRTISVANMMTTTCQGGAATCDQISYYGWDGALRIVEVGYTPLGSALRPGFGLMTYNQLFPEGQNENNNTFDVTVVSYILYPDESEFQFQYNSYGEVAEVTLPTGGAYQYDYTGAGYADGFVGPYSDGAVMIDRELSERREYAVAGGPATGSTTYTAGLLTSVSPSPFPGVGFFPGLPGPLYTTVRTIAATDLVNTANPPVVTIHSYGGTATNALLITGVAYDQWWEGLEYQTQFGQSASGQPLETQILSWEQGLPNGWWGSTGGPVSNPQMFAQQTILNDVSPNLISEVDYGYDVYNNITSKAEYDYGSGTLGALKRYTTTSYVTAAAYVTPSTNMVNLVSLPLSVVVSNGTSTYAQTEYCYDGQTALASWCSGQTSIITGEANIVGLNSSYGTAFTTRGNVTFLSRWLSTGSTWLNTTATYDVAGNPTTVKDPLKNTTTASYANYPQNAYASPTSITNALNQTTKWTYDYNSGRPASSQDPNQTADSITTAYVFNDPLDRLTQVRVGTTAGQCSGSTESDTNYSYPSPTVVNTYQDQNACNDRALNTTVNYDGFGRLSSSLLGDPLGTIEVDRSYDGLDRSYSVSNPYQTGSETPHYTTNSPYDSLGRILAQTTDDGAATLSNYSGNTTTITDPATVARTLTTDALGRLSSALESPGNSLQFLTSYAYDPLNDLTQVCAGAAFNSSGNCPSGYQFRNYAYDSLSRLTSAVNPETLSIATSYTYDADGNLQTKSDPNGNTMTMVYDALNRVTSKTYSVNSPTVATPTVTYCYDGATQGGCAGAPSGSSGNLIGRLTQIGSSASITSYNGYDPRGDILQSTQATGAGSYSFSYTYNLANVLTGETFPSGRTVAWGYDSANRIKSVTGTPPGGGVKTYASSVLYASQGDFSQIDMGNGLVEVRTYDPYHQQPIGVTLGTSATDSSRLALGFAYCPGASPPPSCATNNGNVQSQTIFPLNVMQTYTYDTLNRLTLAAEGASSWSEGFGYDSFGNRWVPSSPGLTLSGLTPTVNYYNPGTNRFQTTDPNFNYDNDGNQTLVSPYAIAYDAENRQTTIAINGNTTAMYTYDGDGQRVTKTITGGSVTTYVYDAVGGLAAEYSTQPPPALCATCFLTADQLGSTRLVTDQNGNAVSRHDYLPFGEELTTANRTAALGYGVTDNVNQKFTGKERDTETGLDFFGARYLSGAQGRWTTPDRMNVTDDKLVVPSTLNKYVYAANNPLRFVDLDGRDVTVLVKLLGSGSTFGHVMLFANDPTSGSSGSSAMMSFGPADTSIRGAIDQATMIPVPGDTSFGLPMSGDELRQKYVMLTIQTEPEVTQEIISYMNAFNEKGWQEWNLPGPNCTTVCRDALKATGILPKDFDSISPNGFWEALYSRFGNPSTMKFTVTNMRYGEVSERLNIPTQTGVDYGNPRYGMNTLDYLVWYMHSQCVESWDPKTSTLHGCL